MAPPREGVGNYSVEMNTQNPWNDPEVSDNVIHFELFTGGFKDGTDFSIDDIQVIDEPGQLPVILLEIGNKGDRGGSTALEVRVNQDDTHKIWIDHVDPGESVSVYIPFCNDKPVSKIYAKVNPRFIRSEMNREDNTQFRDFRPVMDLAVEDLSVFAPRFEEGEERFITVNFTIRNLGRTKVEEDFITKVTTSLFDEDEGREAYIHTEGEILPGEAIHVSEVFEEVPDEFYIKVEADAGNQLMEDDELNNLETTYYKNPAPNKRRWFSSGPSRIYDGGLDASGRLYQIAINPKNSNEIFVGAGCGASGNPGGSGVWKTTNGGSTWYPVSDAVDFLMVNALAIDPKSPARIILGTPHVHQDSCILWQSLNSGSSWKKLSTLRTNFQGISVLLIDPAKSNMYTTTTDGVYVSTDNGVNWIRTLSGTIKDLVMDQKNPGTLYAAVKDNSGFHLYRTTKFGQSGSWSKITGCGTKKLPAFSDGNMDLAISGSKLFVSYMNNKVYYIYASTNKNCQGQQGPEFDKVLEKNDLNTTLSELHADPNNPNNLYAYWAGPSSIWVSHDGGKSIRKVQGKAPHVDTHGFAFDPNNSKILYVLSDGGIFKSTDMGKDGTWSFVGEGILNAELFHMAIIQSDPETVIAGTQDNGNITKQKSAKWKVISGAGGDGAFVEINPQKKDEFYTMHQHARTLRKHSGTDLSHIGCTFNPCAYFHAFRFTLVPDDPERILVYYNDTLWTAKNPVCQQTGVCEKNDKSRGSLNVWKVLWETPGNAGSVQAVKIDPKMDIYYAGTSSGTIYYSEDKGKTFDTTVVAPFRAGIFDIGMDPDQPDLLYISHNKNGTNRIRMIRRYYLNGQLSYSTNDITFGFPSKLRAYTLAVDPITPYVIYAGTQRGVYRAQSFDNGNTWIWKAYRNGMPKATHVSDLEIYQKTGFLRAATKGRGVLSIRNYDDDISVEIIPLSQTVMPGNSGNYTVKVSNSGTSTSKLNLSASGLDLFQYGLAPGTLSVQPGQTVNATLSVQIPMCFPQKDQRFIFSVTAQKVSNVKEFGKAEGQLLVKTLPQQFLADSYEKNDEFSTAKNLSVSLNQSSPWNQTPTKITKLNTHIWSDVDFFKIQFSSNSKAECIGGGGSPKFGSLLSAFQPKYNPGGISITVKEKFCRPMDVAIYMIDPSNISKTTLIGKYKTSNTLSFNCPSDNFKAGELFAKIWRSEGDHVEYEIEVQLHPWSISLGKPLYKLPPVIGEWVPEWYWYNFLDELDILQDRLMQYREFDDLYTEGQMIKIRADLEIGAGNPEEAFGLLDHSQEIFESLGSASALGDVFRSRAQLALRIGEEGLAYEQINAAVEHHMEIGNREAVVEDVKLLSEIAEITGDLEHAMNLSSELYMMAKGEHHPKIQLATLNLMTDLLMKQRDIEGAVAGIILMEHLGAEIIGEKGFPSWTEKENSMIGILGKKGYQEMKMSLSQVPEETIELKTRYR
jgi:photosystem II stability/assembly factor-like uncharacterized protein